MRTLGAVLSARMLAGSEAPPLVGTATGPVGPLGPAVPVGVVDPLANVATTLAGPTSVTSQVACVPVHAPPQPVKTEPVAAAAVSVTLVFEGTVSAQLAPQLTPAGLLVTTPAPVPL